MAQYTHRSQPMHRPGQGDLGAYGAKPSGSAAAAAAAAAAAGGGGRGPPAYIAAYPAAAAAAAAALRLHHLPPPLQSLQQQSHQSHAPLQQHQPLQPLQPMQPMQPMQSMQPMQQIQQIQHQLQLPPHSLHLQHPPPSHHHTATASISYRDTAYGRMSVASAPPGGGAGGAGGPARSPAPPRISLLPAAPQPQPDYSEPPPFKKIRLAPNEPPGDARRAQAAQAAAQAAHSAQAARARSRGLGAAIAHPVHMQPLRVDTGESCAGAGESLSPLLELTAEDRSFRTTKDELLQQIAKVDRDIALGEQALAKLHKKEAELRTAAGQGAPAAPDAEEAAPVAARGRGAAQAVYADNRRRAALARAALAPLAFAGAPGPPCVPVYNQPQDADAYREHRARHHAFRRRLAEGLRRRRRSRDRREAALAQAYARRQADWLRRVERLEAAQKRKAKDAKNRDFFEKVFPELRKQREDRERFNRVGSRIKSDADMEEIMDGLQEQELEEKKMRSYAVVPPLPLDARGRRERFRDRNGAVADMEAAANERRVLNAWTPAERDAFRDKYLQHPKNFGAVASFLERKSVRDCVRFYYLTKKTEAYKQTLRKSRQRPRQSRNPQKAAVAAAALADAMGAGVMTRQQREQQKSGGGRPGAAAARALAPARAEGEAAEGEAGEGEGGEGDAPAPPPEPPPADGAPQPPPDGEPPSTSITATSQHITSSTATVVTNADPSDSIVSRFSPSIAVAASAAVATTAATTPAPAAVASPVAQSAPVAAACAPAAPCAACGAAPGERPASRSRAARLGLADLPAHARLCNHCHYKTVRSRYTRCPVATCPVPRVRTKRLRQLPLKWQELAPEIKEPVIAEFRIPPNMTKCCLSCLKRIARRLAPHLEIDIEEENDVDARFNDDEVDKLKTLLREHGSNWQLVSDAMLKTAASVKSFYCNFRSKYGLDAIVGEFNKAKYGEDIRPASEDDLSGSSTSSCEEHTSDTASVGSPSRIGAHRAKAESEATDEATLDPSGAADATNSHESHVQLDEKHLRNISLPPAPPSNAPQNPVKIVIAKDEYDSSATETADEENESPTTRQSPKVLQIQTQTQQYPTRATITVVPSVAQHNGPALRMTQPSQQPRIENSSGASPLTVRDVMLNVIEMSIMKNNAQASNGGKANATLALPGESDGRGDVAFVREYRTEANSLGEAAATATATHRRGDDSLATLSVVNSHGHGQAVARRPQIARSPQRAATITPVNPTLAQDVSAKDGVVVVQIQHRQQDETLDLSVKKPREGFGAAAFPAKGVRAAPAPARPPSVTLYRTSEPTYVGYHRERAESPSVYVSAVPMAQRGAQPTRLESPVAQAQAHAQAQAKLAKAAPRLSPKAAHGPKGSITRGTPVDAASAAALAPRFDAPPRRTPPEAKAGSITQGTPVHLPPHRAQPQQPQTPAQQAQQAQDKRAYDYYSGKRRSPGGPYSASPTPPRAASPSGGGGGGGGAFASPSPYSRPPSYGLEQRQIIYADYITSQQMHGAAQQRRGQEVGAGGPGGPGGPGGAGGAVSPAGARSAAAFAARASPAERRDGSPGAGAQVARAASPLAPQRREGVIQRHSAAPSPAAHAPHAPPPQHYPPPGHEAFSSLVDVAVQQPSLPVPRPHRKEPPSLPSLPSHDKNNHLKHQESIRYQQERFIHRDLAIQQQQQQIHHQQQMQRHQAAIESQRLHKAAQQQYQDRIDRERERERDRHNNMVIQQQERDRERQVAVALHQQQQQQAERDRHMAAAIERHHHHTFMQHHHQQQIDRQHQQQQNAEEERARRDRDRERERDRERLLVGPFSVSVSPAQHLAQPQHHAPPPRHIERQQQNDRTNNIGTVSTIPTSNASAAVTAAANAAAAARHGVDGTLTAASLIDAIITHQINQNSGEPSRDTPRGQFSYLRDGHGEEALRAIVQHPQHPQHPQHQQHQQLQQQHPQQQHPQQQHPQHPQQAPQRPAHAPSQLHTKSITLGELTDSIIAKDFATPHPNSHPDAPQPLFANQRYSAVGGGYQTSGATVRSASSPEAWKRGREEVSTAGNTSHSLPPKHLPYIEPVSPPDHHHSLNRGGGGGGGGGGGEGEGPPLSTYDYVKKRIVEVFRTEEDLGKREAAGEEAGGAPAAPPAPPVAPLAPVAAYAYPFSALTVGAAGGAGGAAAGGAPPAAAPPERPPPAPPEPAPLMSAQYEPLSDED